MMRDIVGDRPRRRCHRCCTSFFSLAFSTLGLLIVVILYSALGASLFKVIEESGDEERINKTRQQVKEAKTEHLSKLLNLTKRRLNVTYDTDTNSIITNTETTITTNETTADITNVTTITNITTITNVITINNVTTITNVTTVTNATHLDEERWLFEASQLIEEYQRFIHDKTRNYQWDGKDDTEAAVSKWTWPGSILYSVSAITTIGYGHVTPTTPEGQIVTILYCIIGVPLTLMCIAKMGHAFATAFRVIYHTCCCAICCLACVMRQQNGKHKVVKNSGHDMNDALGALVIGTNERVHNTIAYSPWQLWRQNIRMKFNVSLRHDTAVPTYLCLLVMASYIVVGAVIFSSWEDWSYTEAAYFCFVTLTTIGFGDFVPGLDEMTKGVSTKDPVSGVDDKKGVGAKDLALCGLYVLVGLALIGMCIDLMQVDVCKKFKWIGRKIGISKPKHAKTPSDAKKERVGLKLSCEALPQISEDNGYCEKAPISRSASHSLEVPSPTSVHSTTTKRSASMPNTPSIPTRKFFSRPSGVSLSPTTEKKPVSNQ